MTNYEKWKAEQPAIERLLEEIQRLAKVYAGNQIALGVLQDIQNWAIEETVEPVEQNDPFEPCCVIQSKHRENIYTPFNIYPLVRVLRSLKPLCRLVPTARPLDILFRRCFRKTTQKNNSQGQSGEAMRSTLDCYFFAWQETSTDGHIVPEGLNRPWGAVAKASGG